MTMEIEEIKTTLRKSGYRATPARIAILSFLQKSRNPISAQQLAEALPRNIDQATVYRTVKSLKQKGIIRQIDLRHNHAHYELADTTDHHHLVCSRCGKIEDVHGCRVDDWESSILKYSKHFSVIEQHALEFYGICKTCKQKNL